MTRCFGRARLAAGALSVVTLCGLAGCSDGAPNGGAPDSGNGTFPTPTLADCRPTEGEPSRGPAFAASGASASHARLRPGADITAEEAAAEAAARRGTPVMIAGTVYAKDCRTPLAGALVQVWQADAKGEYGPGHGSESLKCCYLMASLRTDARGRYSIATIRPGHYRGADPPPPAHIHFNVVYPGTPGVATELVFAGDPYLTEAGGPREVIELQRESGPAGEVLRGRFDIVVPSSHA